MSLRQSLYPRLPRLLQVQWDRVDASPLGSRLARGAFWSLVGAVISRGLGLVASILVARMLGKEGFGELGMIQSTVGMFGTFAGFGLGLTATKHVAEFREKDPAKAGRILALSGVVAWVTGGVASLALALAAPWLAEHTIAAPQLADELRIGSLLVLLGAVNGAQTGALAGFEAFKRIAVVSLWAGLANFPCLVVGCYLYGLPGAVWGLVAALGVNCVLNRWAMVQEARRFSVPLWSSQWRSEVTVLWNFSLPAALAGAAVGPVTWVCSAMLVNQPKGYAEMGIYNAANQWYNAVLFLPGILGQAVLPVLSEEHAQNENRRVGKVLGSSMAMSAAFAFPIVAVASLLSPLIMDAYGPAFRDSWPVMVVVLLTSGLLAVQTVVGQIIAASGRMWLGLAMNAGWGLVLLGGSYEALSLGAMGLAIGRLVAYLVHATWTFAFAYWLIRQRGTNVHSHPAPRQL
jgi:O-antigen/teichoic acid export membrane protein